MILASLSYVPTTKKAIQRNLLDGFVVGWWNMTIIQSGQYTILREQPFGGYRIHLRWKDWFWNWNSSTCDFVDAVDFLYATAPSSTTPINIGTMKIVIKYATSPVNGYVINLQCEPNGNKYCFVRFPNNTPSSFWRQQPHTFPATLLY